MICKLLSTLVFLTLLYCFAPTVHAQISSAEYMVTFESSWSMTTHPDGFPSNPHFSGLIGATHDSTIIFWEPGGIASAGIESMAETGSKTSLTGEINMATEFGRAETLISGGGIGVSPGNVTLNFEITSQFPLVTLVSMLAPSPDWFVGVHNLPLFENGAWINEQRVELFVYDAGTDSGVSYTSANEDTQPAENIFRIETPPFLSNDVVAPVATFTFDLISVVSHEQVPQLPTALKMTGAYPNPFSSTASFKVSASLAEHVHVEVFDLLGRQVQSLFTGMLPAGTELSFSIDGAGLSPGLYLVRATGSASSTQLVSLIK